MNNPLSFSGKTVVVAGGTSGINRAVAEHFASLGAAVAVFSRSQDKVEDTLQALQQTGARAAGFAADVRDYASVEAGLQQMADTLGAFDVVVSGAAGNFPALASSMSANGFKSVVDIDLAGSYHVARAAYPLLKRPGSLIHISAPQAQVAMAGQAHVCAAKAGVDMLTRTLALEWGPEGIRVNSVVPGPIDGTEGMARLAPTEAMREACRQSVPLKRMGSGEDIANACAFLASPLASYINGVILPVDGGWLAGGAAVIGAQVGNALTRPPKNA